MRKEWKWAATAVSIVMLVGLTGCPRISGDDLEDIADKIGDIIENIQDRDPRTVVLPPAAVQAGNTVVINNNVNVITDVRNDLIVDRLPNITLIGLENETGLDGLYTFYVDGVVQRVFVFDGEGLLLEYPCLDEIDLVSEEYFDPFTGEFVDFFEIPEVDGLFLNGPDFICGDGVIFTFDQLGVFANIRVDL
jgi:hypothetical protein